MNKFRKFVARLRSTLLILVLAVGQVVGAAGPFMQLKTANAAPLCVVDSAGANDEPGQKDLTKLCVDYAGVPTTVTTTWNWDETGTSGSNTMDACNLFDTDGDGNVNYSVCVTTQNDPATFQTLTTYSCGDDKIDRCTSPASAVSSGATSCSVSQVTNDPFPTGTSSPKDTQGSCTVQLSTVGGASAKLVDVCSYPSTQPNSDPSDCVIARNDFGKVELIKDVVPNSDTGLFNLIIDGPESGDTVTVNNQGDGGTTGERVVKKGTVIVKETAGTNTTLSNYSTNIVCKDLNGTGTTLASGNPTGSESRQLQFTLAEDADVVCTITNTRQNANIQVVKDVINDNGGTKTYADFTFQVNGGSEQTFLATTSPDGARTISVPVGTTYTITEPQANSGGYSTSYSNCTNITPVVGQTQTCTITNDDIAPQLTVTKHVVNDNGGAAVAGDFTLNVTATNPSDASFPGDESGTTITLNAGNYSADEDNFAGYTKTLGTDCSGTIAVGEHKYCTITNDDQPVVLTLIKLLPNDNGGTATEDDFNVYIDGLLAQWGANNLDAGSYTVSEDTLPGYLASGWGTDCDAQGNIVLMPGQTLICTITNDDEEPSLTLVKEVTNDNGGTAEASAWTLTASGPTGFSGSGPTVSNGASFDAGTYNLSESGGLAGYTASDWDCQGGTQVDGDTVTIGLGEDVTCTITNNDNTPVLHLRKVVVNDNGGSATLADFTLTADGSNSNDISGTSPVDSDATLDADTFALSENGPAGYTASAWVCEGGTQDGAIITVGLGQEVTCTITNDDDAPSLTLVKEVTTDNGGTAEASDWTLTANGPTGFSGAGPSVSNGASFDSGTYDLSESGGPASYTASDWVCEGGTQDDGDSITLGLGESATCTITNDDQAPTLTLVKEVVNDNSGTASDDDWTLTADPESGSTISGNGSVTDDDAQANTPYSLSEDGPSGYFVKTDWDCTGTGGSFDAQTNKITLALNADVTCTIINDDDAHPDILLTKTGPAAAHEGDEVTYNFSAENTGDEPLANVTINDPLLSSITYVSGDTNTNDILDVDETWQFTGSYTIPESQITDVYNTATVCGDPRDGQEVCDDDDHNIDILHPSITIEKSGPAYGHEGQLIGYDFVVTNTGDTTLYNVTINDDIATGESCEKNILTAGESMNCTASYLIAIPTVENVINNVDACGTDILQMEVCDDDDHELDVLHPSIQIVKTGPAEAHEGDNVTYTFTVTNTGDIALSNTTVTDDIAGTATYVSGDTNSDDKLGLTETWIFTVDFVVPAEQEANVDNTATACGIDPLQLEVCDEDDHTLDVLHPSIHVEKTGPDTANPEDTVTYTFTVTNTGDTPLDVSTVSDNVAGNGVYQSGDSNTNNLLDLTETWIYTVDYTIPSNQDSNINNTVTVCADDNLEAEVCDDDDHTLIVLAKVKVTKYNDYNRNGQYDPDETELVEPTLPGWEFKLNGEQNCEQFELFVLLDDFVYEDECQGYNYNKTQTTGDDGTTTFTGVRPGVGHELSETLQDGWQLSNIHCSGDERGVFEEDEYYVYASPGETVECFVGNYQDTVLQIEKSNNRPSPTDLGDTVTYTIKVTVPENSGPSYNTTVTDLPPEGFTYVPGSWTASSSVRGNLVPGTTTEPTYASPGLWQLGNLLPGEVVTLTYKALIASTVSPGTYPDVAFALGCETPSGDCEVLSNVSAGADTPFVASKVSIKSPQVLAATTTVLVNTGAEDIWSTMMAATLLMGLALATTSVRRQKKGATL